MLSERLSEELERITAACPLVPVIAIDNLDEALPLARALVDGGITILEITLRTVHGVEAIRQLREALPDVWVGAGTVTTVEQYRAVEAAGAQFVITPGSTRELLEYGVDAQAPLLPGVSTLSEMMEGYRLGYRQFKFFPAEVAGGIAALKAFSGPFSDVCFCPTGGIRQDTAADYLQLPNVAAVGGTWLTPKDAIATGDWSRITDIARASLSLVKG
ncbi:bifunctional 4-hydroxy-2-oxoglutarate aldolase/2-dehydro-3-deoxy-phosphogluconate aldolase [Mangrovitalea sediminis]|uniref:bifunctional 4-hydroxy-2-oxoglutarate aldolase/2-dehydro-3-deoxy-phosphogluconate aldolase n=1 Tax=Mangrovitalea sediminis TaxID=1982043 RepID=UPI001D0D3D21